MLALNGIPTSQSFPGTNQGGCQLLTGFPQTMYGSHLDVTVGNAAAICRLITITDTALGMRGGIQESSEFVLVAGPGQIRDSSWDNVIGFLAADFVPGTHATIYATLYEKGDGIPTGGSAYGGTLTSSGSTGTLVTGSIVAWPNTSAPAGAVICDGSTYNSVTDPSFAPLFGVIGISFGGSGASSFKVPDIEGRAIFGLSASFSLGQNDTDAVANRSPVHNTSIHDSGHTHGINDPQHFHTINNQGSFGGSGEVSGSGGSAEQPVVNTNNALTGITVNAASTGITAGPGGSLHTDAPSFIILPWIIYK